MSIDNRRQSATSFEADATSDAKTGEYIASAEHATRSAHLGPGPETQRSRVASVFAVAEARLNAAHAAVAEHVDRRAARQFTPEAALGGAGADPFAAELAERMATRAREDLQARQRNIADRLSAGMQALAFDDIAHATHVADHAGNAAASAVSRERDITPDAQQTSHTAPQRS